MLEIFIGLGMVAIALHPNAKVYPGRLGTKQVLPPIEPAWIGRLFIGGVGLAAILDGILRMRHRSWESQTAAALNWNQRMPFRYP